MKHFITRLVTVLLVAAILFLAVGTTAAAAGYTDVSGHWAEETLTKAVNEGLLEGSNGKLSPDDIITGAEMISILTRLFSAEEQADLSNVSGIGKSAWYYEAAAKAVAMGIIAPKNDRLDLDEPVRRLDAFLSLSEAFQLTDAAQDTAILNGFTDGGELTGAYRPAVAALASAGYIEGYGDALHINNPITRAEFVTALYKIADVYEQRDGISVLNGGLIVPDNAALDNTVFSSSLYFDCSSHDIRLQNVQAPAVVIRSAFLSSLELDNTDIGRLVFAAGSGDLNFLANTTNHIDTAVIGTGSGKLSLDGQIGNIEITGSDREVIVNTSVKNLVVSGSGNRILINSGVSVGSIKTLPGAGSNTITMNGTCEKGDLYGPGNVLSGTGTVDSLTDNAGDSVIKVNAPDLTVNESFGLNSVTLSLSAPDSVTAYEQLQASIAVDTPDTDIVCTGRWYIGDTLVSSEQLNLGEQRAAALSFDATAFRDEVPVSVTLTFMLSYSTSDGVYQEVRTEKSLTLESRNKFSAQEVLSLVTTGYKGDYTLAWAESNDYDSILKEEWVNLKDYTSKTDYLVWVSIAYQRVNVFTGTDGNWKLEKTFIVGTGASGHATPTGVFTILTKRSVGWTTSAYTVEPLVNFYSSAYAFHSRLYYPNTTTIMDPRIGFPVSHGCIRMYDEDVAYMFNTVPVDTTVVIY